MTPEQLAKLRMLMKLSKAPKPNLNPVGTPWPVSYGRTKSSEGS